MIEELEALYRQADADRTARLSAMQELESLIASIQDRAAAHEQQLQQRISELEQRAATLNAQYEQQQHVIERQTHLLDRLQRSYIFRGMRRLGLWEWLDTRGDVDEHARHTPRGSKELRCVAVDLSPVLPGGENGGAKVVVLELIRHLAKLAPNCEFVLLTSEKSHQELAVLDAHNVRRVCVHGVGVNRPRNMLQRILPPRALETATAAYRSIAGAQPGGGLLRQLQPDVLFCPFTAPFFFEPGTPAVSIIHDLQYLYYPQLFGAADRAQRSQHFRQACRVASTIVCVSEFVRGTVLENSAVAPERVITIHTTMGGRLSRTSDDERHSVIARFDLQPQRFLLYPANFWAHKNHEMLLTAFGMYTAANPGSNLKLVLTGAPSPRREELLEVTRRMGLAHKVVFPGFVPEHELAALMDGCMAVVLPSLFEGFGMPALEAMSAGKPVLASNVTSLPEVCGDAALFFDPRKPVEIVKAITRIERDSELQGRLREKGLQRVAMFGGPEVMASRYLSVLRDAVSGPVALDPGIYGTYEDGWAGERITIAFHGHSEPQQLSLKVSLPEWVPVEVLSLTVVPETSGAPKRYRVKRGEALTISRVLGGGPGIIEFHCSPTFQPQACALGEDTRMLSCQVHGAEIVGDAGHTTLLRTISHAA